MADLIENPGPRPTIVTGLRPGGDPFVPSPVAEGNTLHGIEGEEFAEFIRYSIFLRDLNRCQRWMEEADRLSGDTRDGLHIAALITFCTCFEGTAGHRSRPLSAKKVFNPEQRAAFRALVQVRNKSVAHDDQTVAFNSVAIELDDQATAKCLSSAIGFIPLDGLVTFQVFPELLTAARGFTYAEREKASAIVIAEFNALSPSFRAEVKSSAGFSMAVSHDD